VRVFLVHSDDRPFEVERFGLAWERAGGGPRELPSVTPGKSSSISALGSEVAGIVLTGGPDVEPRRYGQKPDPGVELHCRPERDALDLDLLARAEREQWPVLAVCYGCQVLAVAAGGSLVQDLPQGREINHNIKEPKDFLAHEVEIGARARFLPPAGRHFAVNSRHHQAIARTGAGQVVVARSPDGVIEAIESAAGDRFVLGVQWHPENLAQEEQVAIFSAFRRACLARASSSVSGHSRSGHGPRATGHGSS
jgi:putative glutamine amidotransferase